MRVAAHVAVQLCLPEKIVIIINDDNYQSRPVPINQTSSLSILSYIHHLLLPQYLSLHFSVHQPTETRMHAMSRLWQLHISKYSVNNFKETSVY